MHRTLIAVVDATRGRLFTLDRTSDASGLREQLVEQRDFVNTARRRRPSELFSDAGTGRIGGRQFAFDDHRDAHVDEMDTQFARTIMTELVELLDSTNAKHLIVCASPHMLGNLRRVGNLTRDAVSVDEVPRDLVKLTPTQLRAHLVADGLLPPAPARSGSN